MTSAGRVVTTTAVQFRVTDRVATTKYVNKGLKTAKIRNAVKKLTGM